MIIQTRIQEKIVQALHPVHLEVLNESHKHSVPKGSETHFKVVIVSQEFEGKNLVTRHRLLNALLAHDLKNGIHALSLHTFTPQEWVDKGGKISVSPPCLGGSK
jgi:BolA protein